MVVSESVKERRDFDVNRENMEKVGSDVFYSISFTLQGFILDRDGIDNPLAAYNIAEDLYQKGLAPQIIRIVRYHKNNQGLNVRVPEEELISLERLCEITNSNEPNPSIAYAASQLEENTSYLNSHRNSSRNYDEE